ncbi:type II secretory pathway, component PulD [Aquisphaera insulae]|uniref:type II secretory pathway, component PulD n=1 Tax=Aquisphaera insulae TaxID=2712864 RepID=UPI002030A35C|nr:type II secretory pathway, component PulD [Aquisphaera insulae]
MPPIKYLEAGARLYNSGDFDRASKYLDAARMYRDELQADEQATLDAYLKELAKVQGASATPPAPAAATAAASTATAPAPTVAVASPAADGRAGEPVITDPKQRARWLLHEAREQIAAGNSAAAEEKLARAEAIDVKWGLFDDTPAKVRNDLKRELPKAAATAGTTGVSASGDPKSARAHLKEARAALSKHQVDQAEAIATQVKGWNLSYSLFEDNPDKIIAAARALRKRDRIRNAPAREQPSTGVYDVLVQESRQLLKVGDLDQAETKAKQAQRMNVAPPLTADRAESVLYDIAAARAGKGGNPAAESPSAAAEREANKLLASGDQTRASEKFIEAEKLRRKEVVRKGSDSTLDAAVKQVSGDSAGAPLLAAPEAAAPAPAPAQAPAVAAKPADAAPELVAAELPQAPAPAPAAAPAPEPAAANAVPDLDDEPRAVAPAAAASTAPAETNKGEQLLAEARALCASGNFPAARQLAEEAKSGKHGVDAKADELISQIGMAEQGGALSLYESALAAMRKGDNARARAYLNEVAAGSSLDENLRTKVQELLKKLPADEKTAAAPGRAVVGDKAPIADAEALSAQRLNAEVGTKIAEARRLQETDPDKAISIYEQSMKAVKASGLSPSLTKPMVRRLEVALELAKKDKVAFEVKMQDKTQRAEIELKRLRILEADKAKKGRMKDLMDKAQAAYAEGNLAEAESYAKKAAEVDPNEVAATMLAYKARMERRFRQDVDTRNAKENGAVVAFQEVDLASVADPEVQLNNFKFPKNFKDLTRERLRMNKNLEVKKDPKVLAIESKLREPISLNLDKQPLSEAITFLQNYTGLNVVLDPKALSDEGLTSAAPVSLTVNNISLKSALKLMLRPLGLVYRVEEEVLLITSQQANTADMYPVTYYVGDLIMPVNRAPQNSGLGVLGDTSSTQTALSQVPGVGNMAPGTVSDASGVTKGERPSVDMTPLIQLITTSIAPGTWRVQDSVNGQDLSSNYGLGGGFGGGGGGGGIGGDEGRPPGSIIPFFLSISLIIRHTSEVHEQIADLLRQLRRLQDLQVSIEVRFITVTDNFFEQIGVDFDFSIQSDSVGKKSTWAVPNSAAQVIPVPGTPGTTGGTAGTGGTGGGIGGGGTGGGTTGGGGVGGGGTGGGTTGGGGIGGGGTGGGGIGGGGIGGGGGGIGGGGGGGIGGGTGGTSNVIQSYLVNPIRDHALGSKLPITVGTQGGGLYNFSQNLQIPFTNTSASLISPTNAVQGAGATLGLAFLSDLEVYFFLTAAQGDTRTNILQAPKVTTFNGAYASIVNAELQWYVAALTPVVGPGSVAFVPQPQPLPNGVTLGVTPVVSADRRYVRMTLSPLFNTIDGFTTIQVPAAVGGAGLGGGSASINATLQLPQTNTTFVNTTVTVPDGGTVLLGGVKRLNEERREFGVPVLSKTPWIDRLFRNVGIGRVSSSLMLMVTPRIIIIEEEEEKLGIPSTATF